VPPKIKIKGLEVRPKTNGSDSYQNQKYKSGFYLAFKTLPDSYP